MIIRKAISLGFHDVSETGSASESSLRSAPARYAIDRLAFRAHLSAIQKTQPDSVRTIEALESTATIPVFLTFDDGAIGAYTCAADDLESLGWRGHFFVTTDWIGKPGFMNPAQIAELRRRGHVIGSHTCSHPARMSALPWRRILQEWQDSSRILADILGEPVESASVSDGYYSRKVGEAAAESGLKYLFNSEPTRALETVNDCVILGRYSITTDAPQNLAGRIAAGDLIPRWNQSVSWALKKPLKKLAGDRYLALRRAFLS